MAIRRRSYAESRDRARRRGGRERRCDEDERAGRRRRTEPVARRVERSRWDLWILCSSLRKCASRSRRASCTAPPSRPPRAPRTAYRARPRRTDLSESLGNSSIRYTLFWGSSPKTRFGASIFHLCGGSASSDSPSWTERIDRVLLTLQKNRRDCSTDRCARSAVPSSDARIYTRLVEHSLRQPSMSASTRAGRILTRRLVPHCSKSPTAVDQETKDRQLRVASRFSHVVCGCFSHADVRPCGLSASSGRRSSSSSAVGQAESSGGTATASDRTRAYRQKADREKSERCPLGATAAPTWPYHRRQRVEESFGKRTRLGQLYPRADRAVPARRQESVNSGRSFTDAATRSKMAACYADILSKTSTTIRRIRRPREGELVCFCWCTVHS